MRTISIAAFVVAFVLAAPVTSAAAVQLRTYPVPSYPHDVAPAADGTVWYTAQQAGALGRLDPRTGKTEQIPLGAKSAPHGVIIGPDGAPWITDGGLNAIVRVDPASKAVRVWPLPAGSGYTNLNTAAFDRKGRVWFTGQNGIYGRLDPASGEVKVWPAPRGRGPYGISMTPDGSVYYASLAGSHIARLDLETGQATVIEPPTPGQGARRIWPDSKGRLWVSEWNAGQLSRYDPATRAWKSWKPPGDKPHVYAVYVDPADKVWISEWTANAILRFDPATERFESFPSDKPDANVRQLLGRTGQVWGAESGVNRLVVVDYGPGG